MMYQIIQMSKLILFKFHNAKHFSKINTAPPRSMANCESRIGNETMLNTENVIVTCTDVSTALGPFAER